MTQKNSLLWNSLPILIGVVIGILALVRGKWQAPLLLLTFLVWGAWMAARHYFPLWTRNRRRHRQHGANDKHETGLSERELANTVLYHVNYRISAILRASFPNASWEWTMDDPALFVVRGGTGRIRVYGVMNFEYADVMLDRQANLTCLPVGSNPVGDQSGTSGDAQFDPRAWYEAEAKQHLISLMNDLNSRGHKQLYIKENGNVCIQPQADADELRKGFLPSFPAKVYWPKLVEMFTQEGFDALLLEERIQVAW